MLMENAQKPVKARFHISTVVAAFQRCSGGRDDSKNWAHKKKKVTALRGSSVNFSTEQRRRSTPLLRTAAQQLHTQEESGIHSFSTPNFCNHHCCFHTTAASPKWTHSFTYIQTTPNILGGTYTDIQPAVTRSRRCSTSSCREALLTKRQFTT